MQNSLEKNRVETISPIIAVVLDTQRNLFSDVQQALQVTAGKYVSLRWKGEICPFQSQSWEKQSYWSNMGGRKIFPKYKHGVNKKQIQDQLGSYTRWKKWIWHGYLPSFMGLSRFYVQKIAIVNSAFISCFHLWPRNNETKKGRNISSLRSRSRNLVTGQWNLFEPDFVYLVGGVNPSEKILVKMGIFPK